MAMPQGWLLVDMQQIVKWGSGGTPKSDNPRYYNGTIPWIIIGDMNDALITSSEKQITNEGLENSTARFVEVGSILLAMYGSIGKLGIAGVRLTTNQAIAFTQTLYGIDNKYLFYWLYSQRSKLQSMGKGGTQRNISQTVINALKVPLPPFTEQHRIVAKIDALFSELDKGVEVLHTVRQQLRTYRQAVLKWAFEGRLSEGWRTSHLTSEMLRVELNAIRIDTIRKAVDGSETRLNICELWQWASIGDLFKVEVGATPSRKQANFWNGSINWVSSGEVKFNRIYDTVESITGDGLQHTSTNVHPVGTVLLAMIGEGKTRGRASILKVPAAHNQNTAALLVGKKLSSEYLYYYLQYNYQNTRRVGSGNNQKALNKERVRMLPFPYTVKEEQDLIVAEIESRLSVCDELEQIVDENLAKAQALRQSILKKVFAGELVPQDPNDEPAEILLERIKAMKESTTKTTTARRARK